MFSLNVGDLFCIPGSLFPDVEINILSIEVDEFGEVIGFEGFTPLMLPFTFEVYADHAGSFRVVGSDLPICFLPPERY